jgi:microcompartment protein CcmK/EutM
MKMRIAQVIGTVTLNRSLPSFRGARLKLAVPLSLDNLTGRAAAAADPLVVWDELGVGMDEQFAMIEGPEAAQAFRPEIKPVDAYNTAILDRVDIDDQPAG